MTAVGGAGVEAQMLSARLYAKLDSDAVIPIIGTTQRTPEFPAFLSGRLWEDFRDAATQEAAYERLLREIHGVAVDAAPPIGPNPFEGRTDIEATLAIRNSPGRWHSPAFRETLSSCTPRTAAATSSAAERRVHCGIDAYGWELSARLPIRQTLPMSRSSTGCRAHRAVDRCVSIRHQQPDSRPPVRRCPRPT